MGDIEERLGEALGAAAEEAPAATGLAPAARRRRSVRRQRRLALAAAVVLVAVAATGVTLAAGDRDDRDGNVAGDPGDWHTVKHEGVLVDVPGDWGSIRCGEAERWGPPDGCETEEGLWIYPSATIDMVGRAGALSIGDDDLWHGYVSADEHVVPVVSPDRELTRRVLASVHEQGQPEVDGSRWTTFERSGLRYQIPEGWGVGRDSTGYAVCAHTPSTGDADRSERLDESSFAMWHVERDVLVTVAAPTQPLAELVMAGVEVVGRPDGSDCTGETSGAKTRSDGETRLVEHDGVELEVPTSWSKKTCSGQAQVTPGTGCAPPASGTGIWLLDASGYQPAMDEGVLVRSERGGDRILVWGGYVLRGTYAVFVAHRDKPVARTLLDQVR